MRIAIIGGGFYGCFLAREISAFPEVDQVELFEAKSSLITGAGAVNQARLHLGFHYPRSKTTIQQTLFGFHRFANQFRDFVYFPKNNIYSVAKGGLVSFEEYIQVFKEFSLDFEVVDHVSHYYQKPDQIEGSLKVGEGVIDLDRLCKFLSSNLNNVKVHLNSKVESVSSSRGYLEVNSLEYGPFDIIINASYFDLNLGLHSQNQIQVLYEIACMVLIPWKDRSQLALTLMDGPFASVYPWQENFATLSSVPFTPAKVFTNVTQLRNHLMSPKDMKQTLIEAKQKILSHGESIFTYVSSKDEQTCRPIYAVKTKLANNGEDSRETFIRRQDRLISIMCGKLDAVYTIRDLLKKELSYTPLAEPIMSS